MKNNSSAFYFFQQHSRKSSVLENVERPERTFEMDWKQNTDRTFFRQIAPQKKI
jgi:hypothetical protein